MLGAVRGAGREEQGRGNEGTGTQCVDGWEGSQAKGTHRPPTDIGCAEPGRRCSDDGP